MSHHIGELVHSRTTQSDKKYGWVPALPLPFYGIRGKINRIRDAWLVLRGKAEAVRWN